MPRLRHAINSAAWLALACIWTSQERAVGEAPSVLVPPAPQTVFLGDNAAFSVEAAGTPPLNYQWLRNGAPLSGATAKGLTFAVTSLDHGAQFSASISNGEGSVVSAAATLTIDLGAPGPAQTNRLLSFTGNWRYNVYKTNLPPEWVGPAYQDQSWPAGDGLLYVEEAALLAPKNTALPLTPGSLPSTCYFRTWFTNPIGSQAYSLKLLAGTVIDDGAVFYLNGQRVFRLGMPDAVATYPDLASRNVGDATIEGPFEWSATNLLAGANLLAAEVHQSGATSSDVVLGISLDAIWQPRFRDSNAPTVLATIPEAGSTLTALGQVEVRFSEPVYGVDATDLLVNGVAATSLAVLGADDYLFRFSPGQTGLVNVTWAAAHNIVDRSASSNRFGGSAFNYVVAPSSVSVKLPLARAAQSTDASVSNLAAQAIDGLNSTFSLTQNLPGSWWVAELARPFYLERLEVVGRPDPFAAELGGLTLRLSDMDDQVVFEKVLGNPGVDGLISVGLPPGTRARTIWVGLSGTKTNAAGNFRVGLAEMRAFGAEGIPYGPEPPGVSPTNSFRVWQSSDYDPVAFPASNAVDGDASTFTHTLDFVNSYWMADWVTARRIDRVEIVNRDSCCSSRLGGLTLRLFDSSSNSVVSTRLTDPGLGGVWTYSPPAGTQARYMRVGLESGTTNNGGNFYVTLAEARVYSGTTNLLGGSGNSSVPITPNLASFKPSYMLRLDETVPVASRANDDNYSTETKTAPRTVDGYWEVDLQKSYALYGIRCVGASGIGYQLTNTIVRLYDESHESVYSQTVTGKPDVFDVDLNGPVFARYVRVGLEDKQRTDPAGGIEFYIGFREVEVFGRSRDEIGIAAFNASTNKVMAARENVQLSWKVDDLRSLELHPAAGSLGSYTGTNGSGSVVVPITRSTEFLLVGTNRAGVFAEAVSVEVSTNRLPLQLSEFVGENKYSLKDDYGEATDWVELRNPRNEPVNLEGWGISDDFSKPFKWAFPAVTIAPHSFKIVFLSGRSGSSGPGGELHAGFRLDKSGGSLVLTRNDGVVEDSVGYPPLTTDLAYGRDLDGNWTYLEPTPGRINFAQTYLGWLKPLDWSHARGFYDTSFQLRLTNNSPGSTTVYSLDGSEPFLPWTSSMTISRTTVLRAQSIRPGYKPARSQTKTFLFINDIAVSPVLNSAITQDPAYAARLKPGLLALPAISLALPGQPEYEEKEGSVEVLWPNGGEPVQVNCGILRFGNAWTKFAKRSIRLKARARYGEAQIRAPLFDGFDRGVLARNSFDEIDLRSGSQDMVERGFYMAGRFVEDSMLDMGSLNPHGRFVHVYLNGIYWGQYDCRELLVDNFMADYLGGSAEDYVVVRGNDNVSDDFVIGAPDPPNIAPWEITRGQGNSYQLVRQRLDVPHLIDFMLLWNYGNCESEFRCCGPVNPGSGFKFWIADADGFLRTSTLGLNRVSRTGPGGLFGALVAEGHPDFKMMLADRIYRHFFNQGAMTPAANDARLAARMSEVRDSLIAECARWGYRSPSNWESAAASVRSTLFPTRTSQLLGYLKAAGLYPAFDPPLFNQYGGRVTNGFQPVLSASAGTIWYTLDGSDPRAPGGGITSAAKVWLPESVTVTNELVLTARVRTAAGQWSALAQPNYLLASRRTPTSKDLLLTEIHYNPAGSDEYEFIELCNASTNLLDLSGVTFSNAVHFVFPKGYALAPGAFAMVVENSNAFFLRYQAPASPYYYPAVSVAGQWVGGLNRSGDTISVVASNGFELATVRFQNGGQWPERANGRGSSLELRQVPPPTNTEEQVRAFLADGHNWGSSSLYHGSPGRFDTFTKTVRISEVLALSALSADWVELENRSGVAVDLAGSALTDDIDAPGRWLFPSNSMMPPGGFVTLSALQLGFGFGGNGGQVYLLEMTGTNVTRFLDSVDFSAVEPEEPVGLYSRSDGGSDFTELRSLTPGGPNSLPRVGPVVMSEIMFSPEPGNAQFIELANITDQLVPLFEPSQPTNVWRLQGVGGFSFPTNLSLAPCSVVIICATNPATFRAQYGVPPSIPVVGPWSGRLNPQGETLKLLRPGPPQTDGTVPYYRVDHVSFQPSAPWSAVLSGTSIERIPQEGYGNDPGSWRASPLRYSPGIVAANRLPTLTVLGNPAVPQQLPMRLAATAADRDGPWQNVSVRVTEMPPGAAFDPATGIVGWTPSAGQPPGPYRFAFEALDSALCAPARSTLEVNVKVTGALQVEARYVAGSIELSCPSLPGETLALEFSQTLEPAAWQILPEPGVVVGDRIVFSDLVQSQRPAGFYRIRWVQ